MIIKFIDELGIFLKQKTKSSLSYWLIVLENASTHQCATMKKYIIEKNLNLVYIPAYSPEMAPVERYFSMQKRKVVKKTNGLHINRRANSLRTILENKWSKFHQKMLEARG